MCMYAHFFVPLMFIRTSLFPHCATANFSVPPMCSQHECRASSVPASHSTRPSLPGQNHSHDDGGRTSQQRHPICGPHRPEAWSNWYCDGTQQWQSSSSTTQQQKSKHSRTKWWTNLSRAVNRSISICAKQLYNQRLALRPSNEWLVTSACTWTALSTTYVRTYVLVQERVNLQKHTK